MTKMEALKKVIKHWGDNLKEAKKHGKFEIHGVSCALCGEYCGDEKCDLNCPIRYHTKKDMCKGGPWLQVYEVYSDSWYEPKDDYTWDDVIKAVELMYLYLVELWYAEGGKARDL